MLYYAKSAAHPFSYILSIHTFLCTFILLLKTSTIICFDWCSHNNNAFAFSSRFYFFSIHAALVTSRTTINFLLLSHFTICFVCRISSMLFLRFFSLHVSNMFSFHVVLCLLIEMSLTFVFFGRDLYRNTKICLNYITKCCVKSKIIFIICWK